MQTTAHRRLDTTLFALADPTRRALIERIARKPWRAGDLVHGFSISRPAVSKHLRVLREAGLVDAVSEGRERIYRLSARAQRIREAREYIERVSRFWDQALAAFKAFAEQEGSQ
jgi:DNA-binding transcriptional ArsR family regulator